MGGVASESKDTAHFMNALLNGVTKISDELRQQILLATFKSADANKNGTISRPELGMMMRKLIVSITHAEIEEMLKEADTNNNKVISYDEFIKWLPQHAPLKIRNAFANSLNTNQDVLRAVFRVWDKN